MLWFILSTQIIFVRYANTHESRRNDIEKIYTPMKNKIHLLRHRFFCRLYIFHIIYVHQFKYYPARRCDMEKGGWNFVDVFHNQDFQTYGNTLRFATRARI